MVAEKWPVLAKKYAEGWEWDAVFLDMPPSNTKTMETGNGRDSQTSLQCIDSQGYGKDVSDITTWRS